MGRYTPQPEVPLVDGRWWKRNFHMCDGTLLFFFGPILCSLFQSIWQAIGFSLVAMLLGVWLMTPTLRTLAVIGFVLWLWPNSEWRMCLWIVTLMTIGFVDAYQRNHPPPKDEWD